MQHKAHLFDRPCIFTFTLGGLPHICGGRQGADSDANTTDICYRFDMDRQIWEQYGAMMDKRRSMAYDYSSEWGLVISGGYDGENYLTSVEQSFDGINFTPLPDLPIEQLAHCLVILDENFLFVTGGKTNGIGNNETFYYRCINKGHKLRHF